MNKLNKKQGGLSSRLKLIHARPMRHRFRSADFRQQRLFLQVGIWGHTFFVLFRGSVFSCNVRWFWNTSNMVWSSAPNFSKLDDKNTSKVFCTVTHAPYFIPWTNTFLNHIQVNFENFILGAYVPLTRSPSNTRTFRVLSERVIVA